MLDFPGNLAADAFLRRHWQKAPLSMPGGFVDPVPTLDRNDLAWLATLDDVESRLVTTERSASGCHYSVTQGPFAPDELAALPERDWTLLVHDVEKHLPDFRDYFDAVPFVPDWRIDDLMVSFAVAGGSVGPHRDNYDVFLCQAEGIRTWDVSTAAIRADPEASSDIALLAPFRGARFRHAPGDVLYLPPGVAHWGVAETAALTFSIGMRAPQRSDLGATMPDESAANPYYEDADLRVEEAQPGLISERAVQRAHRLLGDAANPQGDCRIALGRGVTVCKQWLQPEFASADDASALLDAFAAGAALVVHGMARVAYDRQALYTNGHHRLTRAAGADWLRRLCAARRLENCRLDRAARDDLDWMARHGAFQLPE